MSRRKRISFGLFILALLAGANWAMWRYEPIRARVLGLDPQPAASSASQHAGHTTSTEQEATGEHAGQKMPAGERKVLYWYDAMNPTYRSNKPGLAPDGMQLVPKYADEEEGMKDMPVGTVKISPTKQQLIGVRTGTVQREQLTRTIRTVAQVHVDETKIARIHVKIAGWVEKVYVDFVGKLVKQGDPLFSLYSPELVSTQQEYLIARRGQQYLGESPYSEVAQGAQSLLRAARDRLRLWDISEDQIKKLEETGEVSRTMTLYSPIDGFVMRRNLYERVYVNPETELYEIADLSTIWVNAEIYEYEVPYVRAGQQATMRLSYFPGKTYSGKVTYVYPTLDPVTRTVKVRLEFPNRELELKPDMFAEVQLQISYGNQIVVPQEAVLDSGTEQVVFVAHGDGYFEPRKIQMGPRLEDRIIVLAGLRPGETIVTSGNFLIDSESRLKSAMGGMKH